MTEALVPWGSLTLLLLGVISVCFARGPACDSCARAPESGMLVNATRGVSRGATQLRRIDVLAHKRIAAPRDSAARHRQNLQTHVQRSLRLQQM